MRSSARKGVPVRIREGLLLLAALATALSGACGGTSTDDGVDDSSAGSAGTISMPADAFPARYAAALCALTDRCCNAAGGSQIEECEMDVEYQQHLDAANARSSGARFDTEAADACLSEIARRRCDADPLNLLSGYFPGCPSVWVGQVPIGEACEADLDCLVEGDASVSCIEGTCQTFEQLLPGSDCDPESHTTVCASAFATCDLESLTCVPLPGDGQACTGECQLGYQCRARVCLPEAGLPGSDCTAPSECQSGVCVGDRCGSVLIGKYCLVLED